MADLDFNWSILTNEALEDIEKLIKDLYTEISNDNLEPNSLWFELFTIICDFPNRLELDSCVKLANGVIFSLTDIKSRVSISTECLIVLEAMNHDNLLDAFAKNVQIDIRIKTLHLDPTLLRSQGIFPDLLKYKYNDVKNNVFAIESYSSLHESSEGYSIFITEILIAIENHNETSINDLWDNLNSTMAFHKLDYNRCFLLLLSITSFYLKSHEQFILALWENSLWWKPVEINYTLQTVITDYLLNFQGTELKELNIITLFIKYGIFDFNTIYNSLGPLDFNIKDGTDIEFKPSEEMENLFKEWDEDNKKKNQVVSVSALSMAAPLALDSDDEGESNTTKSKSKLKQGPDVPKIEEEMPLASKLLMTRKLSFLDYLLYFEMKEESLFILSQYPFLPIMSDSIADNLNTVVENMITPYFQKVVKPTNITCNEDDEMVEDSIMTTSKLFDTISLYLDFNKHKIYRSPLLVSKLIKIMKSDLKSNEDNKEIWLQMFRQYIFPCLPFLDNIPLTCEAFDTLLNHYSLAERYNLYGEYQMNVKTDEFQKLKWDSIEKKTRDLLKRMSIENVSTFSRSLNKLTCNHPLAAATSFITHIESYSSLIELVTECSKFFNDFSWDVITFQLLNKLNSNKSFLQDDGLNYNQWFINLSKFIGELGKVYPDFFQIGPILTNIVKSLTNGEFNILEVLNEILDSMTGIKTIDNLTIKQILKLNGERSLRKLIYFNIGDERFENERSCKKLINSMLVENEDILSELLILLCQTPQLLITNDSNRPLKFVNRRTDEVTSLIHTLLSSIDENMETSQFIKKMTPFSQLVNDFKISPQWAFEIWRSHWSKLILDGESESIIEGLNLDIVSGTLSTEFYFTFWQLNLYDIVFNDLSYMMEYADIKSKIQGLEIRSNNNKRDSANFNLKEQMQIEKEYNFLRKVYGEVPIDMETHKSRWELTKTRLDEGKSKWFTEDIEYQPILERCILPRVQHSSFDAVYSAKFLLLLDEIETNNFDLIKLFDLLFVTKFLPMTLFTNTSTETENLALFYQLILNKLNEWVIDEHKLLVKQWHSSLMEQIFSGLKSQKYTTRNNTILFLRGILPSFPLIESDYWLIFDELDTISNEDERADLKLASRAFMGLMKNKSQRGEYKSVWDVYELSEEETTEAKKAKEARIQLETPKEEPKPITAEGVKPYGFVGLENSKTLPKGPTTEPANITEGDEGEDVAMNDDDKDNEVNEEAEDNDDGEEENNVMDMDEDVEEEFQELIGEEDNKEAVVEEKTHEDIVVDKEEVESNVKVVETPIESEREETPIDEGGPVVEIKPVVKTKEEVKVENVPRPKGPASKDTRDHKQPQHTKKQPQHQKQQPQYMKYQQHTYKPSQRTTYTPDRSLPNQNRLRGPAQTPYQHQQKSQQYQYQSQNRRYDNNNRGNYYANDGYRNPPSGPSPSSTSVPPPPPPPPYDPPESRNKRQRNQTKNDYKDQASNKRQR